MIFLSPAAMATGLEPTPLEPKHIISKKTNNRSSPKNTIGNLVYPLSTVDFSYVSTFVERTLEVYGLFFKPISMYTYGMHKP